MSGQDIVAERDRLAYTAGATDLPLVGLTAGTDGHWSARFWHRDGKTMSRHWCDKVRVVGPQTYSAYYNDEATPPPPRQNILKRTFDTWGGEVQATISRLHIGVIGLGSVGTIVAESLARIGVSRVTLIDPDIVEEHNLDRLLYGTVSDIGTLKVYLAKRMIEGHATTSAIKVIALPMMIQEELAYSAALDCDIIFSCVDRPVARDVLNYLANAHLIPVVDGGVAVETKPRDDRLLSAHWRAHLVTPYHQCMRCNGQYDSSMVVMELDGSLDDPSYISNLPTSERHRNQNVFPFSLGAAALQVNLMLHYLLSESWWPIVKQQDHQFVTGTSTVINCECKPHCWFRRRCAQGDVENPSYLLVSKGESLTEFQSDSDQDRRPLWLRVIDKVSWRFRQGSP